MSWSELPTCFLASRLKNIVLHGTTDATPALLGLDEVVHVHKIE